MNVLSFSGGRTSAYMLAHYPSDLTIFCNTGKEAHGTLEFVRRCGEYFDKEIIWLEYDAETKFKAVNFETASRKGEPFEAVIKKQKFLPNQQMRFCTSMMKVTPIEHFLKYLDIDLEDVNMMLGIRKDEPNRYFKLKNSERSKWSNSMPLHEDGITKNDVLKFWGGQPFDLNIHSHEGNCDLCFLKGMQKKITLLRDKPEIANWWIEMEKLIGGTFNKDNSVETILKKSQSQMAFNFDESIDCFCNID